MFKVGEVSLECPHSSVGGKDLHLSAHITELGCYTEEEFVLPAHGLVRVTAIASNLHSLQLHIRVRDFGDLREVEDDGK